VAHTAQRKFLDDQLFGMTLAATARRSNLYAAYLSEAQRKPFQASLRGALESYAQRYTAPVLERHHLKHVNGLAEDLTRRHSGLLEAGRLRFGHAQKALNLYLKYLWCVGRIPEPPHCPIDSLILRKVPGFTEVRWTQLATATEYMSIITAAKVQASAKNLSLAQWELEEYNRFQIGAPQTPRA
jgi:hypothetical protein